jgi:hypothetical protein
MAYTGFAVANVCIDSNSVWKSVHITKITKTNKRRYNAILMLAAALNCKAVIIFFPF